MPFILLLKKTIGSTIRRKFAVISFTTQITEIAFESGFRDIRSFNMAFKKQTGSTPSNYRKEFSEASSSTSSSQNASNELCACKEANENC